MSYLHGNGMYENSFPGFRYVFMCISDNIWQHIFIMLLLHLLFFGQQYYIIIFELYILISLVFLAVVAELEFL